MIGFTFAKIAALAGETADGCAVFRESVTLELRPEEAPMAPTIIRAAFRWEGTDAPALRYELWGKSCIYRSMTYDFAPTAELERHAWRVPPFVGDADCLRLVLNVPQGSVLYLRNMAMEADGAHLPWAGGLRLNAHLGFWGLCPDNTMPAFELANACGYPACIVVPKMTADGKLVCIHDDTINHTARDADGNAPAEPMKVHDMTLDELRTWEYGSYKHEIWRGTQIPTLEEFFAFCAKTGMRPMFSTHPDLTDEGWMQVRELLSRYGLTKLFHVKSFGADCLAHAWRFLGDSIEGYTYDVGEKTLDIPKNLAALAGTGIDRSRVRVGIEIPQKLMTEEHAAAIRAGGCFASVWSVWNIPASRYRALMAMGVTEVTDDFNCSVGLCW